MDELLGDTSTGAGWLDDAGKTGRAEVLGLCLAWSMAEPARVGEVALVAGASAVLGRGPAAPGDGAPKVQFGQVRPGGGSPGAALSGQGLSRVQLALKARPGGLEVENVGRAVLRVNGVVATRASVAPGDVLAIDKQLVLLVVTRPRGLLARTGFSPPFAFGQPDEHGVVGESVCAWMLRDELGLVARRPGHVLVLGPSGAGKELVARALHAASLRASRPFVARNAATLPPGVVDAELFGNAHNYPNPGMRERAGLVGEAEGGTLFLDEIGELPAELQAHLLRLLDSGEYHRLGESAMRRANVRVVAATNRDERSLKLDLGARFALRLRVPGLDARVDDVPLLARHALRLATAREPMLMSRFVEPSTGEVRIDPSLIDALLRHQWSTHVRELDLLLSTAIAGSQGAFIALTDGVAERLLLRGTEPSAADIRQALERTQGNVSRAAKELSLSSRDVLYRLMKKHGIKAERGDE